MAIGNLFDNRNQPKRGSGFQYEWKGDISFRSEDIEFLYKQLKSGVTEPKMFMSGESKQVKVVLTLQSGSESLRRDLIR